MAHSLLVGGFRKGDVPYFCVKEPISCISSVWFSVSTVNYGGGTRKPESGSVYVWEPPSAIVCRVYVLGNLRYREETKLWKVLLGRRLQLCVVTEAGER